MKAHFILGKKQIILAALVLVLGAAVYLNWQFANSDGNLKLAADASTTSTEQVNAAADKDKKTDDKTASSGDNAVKTDASAVSSTASTNDSKVLGEAQLVSSKAIVDENYFAVARLARTKSRDEAVETISTIINNDKLTAKEKEEASAKAVSITDIIESESRIENLIKAKGFAECVVYITNSKANVVVQSAGLNAEQATQIKNIVVSEGKIKGENISITEVK